MALIRMRLPKGYLAALAAALIAPLSALPAKADPNLAANARLAWSEHLRLRGLGSAMRENADPRQVEQLRATLLSQGYYTKTGEPQRVAELFWLSPVLGWDGNINGGVLRDSFEFNGWTLTASPEWQAKSGLVTGAKGGSLHRLAWSEGRFLELQSQIESAWSPKHEIARHDAYLQLCSKNHLSGWRFLDLCASGARSLRVLERQNSHQISAKTSQLFATGSGLHEAGLTLARVDSQGPRDQSRIGLSLESLWSQAATRISITLGEDIAQTNAMKERVDLGLKLASGSRDWEIDLWGQRADGGFFAGQPRQDKVWGIGLTTDLRPAISMRMGYAQSRSTAGFATYDQLSFDLNFKSLRW